MAITITACHIGNQSGRYEPRRKNNFTLIIPGLSVYELALQSCDAPSFSLSPTEVDYGNQKKKVPSAGDVDDISFTCFDDLDCEVSDELYAWYELGYDSKTGKVGLAKDCKKDCTLVLLKPDGSVAKRWKLQGCFITNITPAGDGYDMASKTEKSMIGVTLAVDGAVPE